MFAEIAKSFLHVPVALGKVVALVQLSSESQVQPPSHHNIILEILIDLSLLILVPLSHKTPVSDS